MAQGDFLKAKVKVKRQFYPKGEKVESGDYAILSVEIVETIEGEPITNEKWGTISIKGIVCAWEYGTVYTLIAKEGETNNFGTSYEIVSFFEELDLTEISNQKIFLKRVLTDIQVVNLFSTLENPLQTIMEHDIQTLCTVKGIGATTAEKIISKYEDQKDYSQAYVALDNLGLSTKMIQKLCKHYGNPNVLVQKIQENPYIVADEVNGIGWAKADEIALKSGIGEFSNKRIVAYIKYSLDKQANEFGDSYVYTNDMIDYITATLGEDITDDMISKALRTLMEKKEIWSDDNREKIALTQYRRLEFNIAKELVRLNESQNDFKTEGWKDVVKNLEKEQGWKFGAEQMIGIESTMENNVVLITGYGGCVDCDTEYFNGTEWKRIADYTKGDKVLQYNEDGSAELVYPKEYIKKECDSMWHFENQRGINQTICEDHEIAYLTSKGHLAKKPFWEFKEMHEKCKSGFTGKFITTFNYNEGQGINLTEFEIRLMCAVICDGHFSDKYENKNICRINIKKQRKKDRLEWILNTLGISYRKEQYNPKDLDFNNYIFEAPKREKVFGKEWYNCTNEQFAIICDEILYWDGSTTQGRGRFSTTIKETADFLQFAFTTQNKRVTMRIDDRVGQEQKSSNGKTYIRKSIAYDLFITKQVHPSIGGYHEDNEIPKIEPYKTVDGYKYCFVVPSHYLVLRRDNKIFITGNCGKSTIVNAMNKALSTYFIGQCALSGRASVNLTMATGMDGQTIHRLLGYNPAFGYAYNKNSQLPYDIIILDEISMVDAGLFYRLVQAIRTGSKLIMLGDYGQLEAIGVGNVLMDLINCGKITHINLTEIHRQAKKSAIALDSIQIWKGKQVIDKGFVGKDLRGELKDLLYDITEESRTTADRIMNHFEELYNKVDTIMDLQVIAPIKNRGECCTYKLNNRIQKYIRDIEGLSEDDDHVVIGEDDKAYRLYVGDKVMNVKNNYNTTDEVGSPVPIMNGNQGIIKKIIDNEILIVEFERLGEVVIPKECLSDIELAYACTTHKLQGSGIKYVICGLDSSHYVMLNKEMLYTMMTRAKKYCVIVGENSAIRQACANSGVKNKKTFLCDLLKYNYEGFIKIIEEDKKREEERQAKQLQQEAINWLEGMSSWERDEYKEKYRKLTKEEFTAQLVKEYTSIFY